jgi:hypothetical protein
MFPSSSDRRTAPASWRDRLRRAADTARAFILLEDQVWEDDLEARGPFGGPAEHPHREPLRPALRARRPGAAQPRPAVCVTPLRPAAARAQTRSRAHGAH